MTDQPLVQALARLREIVGDEVTPSDVHVGQELIEEAEGLIERLADALAQAERERDEAREAHRIEGSALSMLLSKFEHESSRDAKYITRVLKKAKADSTAALAGVIAREGYDTSVMTSQWIIERGQPEGLYIAVWIANGGRWITVARQALMFSSRASAEQYIAEKGLVARAVERSFSSLACETEAEPKECVCQRCGHDYAVWSAPSDIWNRVVRAHGGDGYGADPERDIYLCPTCFTTLGVDRCVATMWLVTPSIGGPVNLARQVVLKRDDDEAGERFASLRTDQT